MVNKRLLKDISLLIKQQNSRSLHLNDYLIMYNESNINKVYSIIKCPYDSVYRHKFIRLNFDIPDNYPHSPPIVTFVNYNNTRIHPNMYEDGKCCSTILNTWPSHISDTGTKLESWTSSMSIETILLTFHSFLDNNPYTYEPGGRDDETYTDYVKFESWNTCLFSYLLDTEQPEIFTTFIHKYLLTNIESIYETIFSLMEFYPSGYYYTPCFNIYNYKIDYENILDEFEYFTHSLNDKDVSEYVSESESKDEIEVNTNFKCNICFDSTNQCNSNLITLDCNHIFHKQCIINHMNNNGCICSLCRTQISIKDQKCLEEKKGSEWIINPTTNRRVKIGSKTYKYLVEYNII